MIVGSFVNNLPTTSKALMAPLGSGLAHHQQSVNSAYYWDCCLRLEKREKPEKMVKGQGTMRIQKNVCITEAKRKENLGKRYSEVSGKMAIGNWSLDLTVVN